MKNAYLLFIATSLLTACGRTDNTSDKTNQASTSAAVTASADTTAATENTAAPSLQNCQSVVKADKLGKPDEYQESAKPVKVSLTLNQDVSTKQTNGGCYFNNTVTVLATKKSGGPMFKRTLLKDDLLYFTKSDEAIDRAVLQQVTYKPTFNAHKYITLTMRLMEPDTKRTQNYTVFMNYFGEIIKVK